MISYWLELGLYVQASHALFQRTARFQACLPSVKARHADAENLAEVLTGHVVVSGRRRGRREFYKVNKWVILDWYSDFALARRWQDFGHRRCSCKWKNDTYLVTRKRLILAQSSKSEDKIKMPLTCFNSFAGLQGYIFIYEVLYEIISTLRGIEHGQRR
jgi:hypothetical protein